MSEAQKQKATKLCTFYKQKSKYNTFPPCPSGEWKIQFCLHFLSFLAIAAAAVALAVGTLVMIQLCQQKQAVLNLSPDERGGIQQITWLQVNRSCTVRSFVARVISQMHSPERVKRAENAFRRDLITLKIPCKAYPGESRGWSCRCRSSSHSRGEGWMYAAELCPLAGTARLSSTACAWGIASPWNRDGFIWIWMDNSHSLLISLSPWPPTGPNKLYSSFE